MRTFRRLLNKEDGATAIEYALLAGMIALVIIGGVTAVGVNLAPIFTNVSTGMTN